jgi:rhamnulokinase
MENKPVYYLAIDFGASGGRHILGHMENGKLILEEMYRFPNGMEQRNGSLCWDTEALFTHVKNGLKACADAGKIPDHTRRR